MKSPHQNLQQLISPEIIAEIQTSFLKKHGAVICIFSHTLQPLLNFPHDVPALARLSEEQHSLFDVFFDLSSIDAEVLQQHSRQSFSDNAVSRAIFPITLNEDFLGLAVLLRFSKTIDPQRDEHMLQTLSFVKHKSISLKTIQDETASPDQETKDRVQELQNIVQLFLEAGLARAQVSPAVPLADDDDKPAGVEFKEPVETTALLFCAPDGQIVDSDVNAADLLGYDDPGDLSDLNFITDLLATKYDREKIRMLFQAEPATKTSVAITLRDESTAQVDVQVNLQRTPAGIVGFECLLSSTTNTSESEDIHQAPLPLDLDYDEERLQALQASYGLMQHQLAQVISPLAQKLEKFFRVQVKDEAIKKELSDINRLTKSLSHLNQQLAYFTLRTLSQHRVVNINELITKIAARLENLAPDSISIETELDKSQPGVLADPDFMVHALGNLCKNAIEAMPSGGTLVLGTRSGPSGKVDIFIRDSGAGITDSIQQHLFEPFRTTKKSINAGLGLPAVYGIVKSHGGDITITSKPGDTQVILSFPVVNPAERTADESRLDAKGYVLIVDDEKDIADVTAMALRRANYGVFTCSTCDEALDVLQQVGDKLQLLILDNQLVGTKGITCAQDLMSQMPNISILFYSGEDDLELMDFIKQNGAGWLKKPFSAKELLTQVDFMITRKK